MTQVGKALAFMSQTALATLLTFAPQIAWSAAPPAGSIRLKSSARFQVQSGGATYTCGKLPPWSYGRMVRGYFYPAKVEIAALKKQLSSAASSKLKVSVKAQLTTTKQNLAIAKPLCAAGPPTTNATPTPSTSGAFDSSGNVTSYGKSLFQIPSNLEGSALRGITKWNLTCDGCHHMFPSGLPLKTYPAIRARIQQDPMYFSIPSEISDQEIADVTAIVNW